MIKLLNSYSVVGYVNSEAQVTLCPEHAPLDVQSYEDANFAPIFVGDEYWEDNVCDVCLINAVETNTHPCPSLGQTAGLEHWYRENGTIHAIV